MPDSLRTQFEALHAERQRSWPAAQLQKNIDQRERLSARYDPSAHIQTGDRLPEFTLNDVEGGTVTRDTIGEKGAVFVFFRFAGCPACNLALPYYHQTLWPELQARGWKLIAVSPQVPERLIDIKTRHGLEFTVASDTDNQLGHALGITFDPEDQPNPPPAGYIGEVTGTNSWTLPQPTVLIVDNDARVRFIEVSPDWLKRTESETILAALREARAAA